MKLISDDRGTGSDELVTPEQRIARRLLERREKGIHPWRALIPRYPASVVAVFLCVVFAAYALTNEMEKNSLALICLFIGVILGKQLRDFVWCRHNAKTFPTMRKFIDWKIVEEAAKGKGSDQQVQGEERREGSSGSA